MKRIFKYLMVTAGVILLLLFGFYQYAISDWNSAIPKQDMDSVILTIKNAPVVPERFYHIYEKINDVADSESKLLSGFFFNRLKDCPCVHVAYELQLSVGKSRVLGNSHVAAGKIERQLDQRQCLNYLFANFDFMNSQVGVTNAAQFYFQKDLEQLTDREVAMLVVMMKNPAYYNPKRRLKLVEEKVNSLGF